MKSFTFASDEAIAAMKEGMPNNYEMSFNRHTEEYAKFLGFLVCTRKMGLAVRKLVGGPSDEFTEVMWSRGTMHRMVDALKLAYDDGDEWAGSFLSSIATTVGVEFV